MAIRDGKTPSRAELDQLAEITADDLEDAARTLKQRVPESKRAVDAVPAKKEPKAE